MSFLYSHLFEIAALRNHCVNTKLENLFNEQLGPKRGDIRARGLFLKRSGNFSDQKANFKIKTS